MRRRTPQRISRAGSGSGSDRAEFEEAAETHLLPSVMSGRLCSSGSFLTFVLLDTLPSGLRL